jgi:Dolichyl-phosphate-mannose-protein mannosyltransferase
MNAGVTRLLSRLELDCAVLIVSCALIFVPYANVHWPAGGLIGTVVLLLLGVALAGGLVGMLWRMSALRDPSPAWSTSSLPGFVVVTAVGVAAQLTLALICHPIPVSDSATYLALAERLAAHLPFLDDQGSRAFFPPGLPLFLAPFIRFFGDTFVAVVVANLALYVVGAASIWHWAQRLFDDKVALISLIVFTCWPTRLLLGGLALKESLALSLILLSLMLFHRALPMNRIGLRSFLVAWLSGLALGFVALSQPGLLLLGITYPIMFRFWLARVSWSRAAAVVAFVWFGVASSIAPWMIRNCITFEGRFCGISTNGGSVFYRANNPKATGLWVEEGEISLSHLPELEQNKKGYQLGREWIRSNPFAALKLSIHKLRYLLGNDDHGPYWAIFRSAGLDHQSSESSLSTAQKAWLQAANAVSLLFWVAILALSWVSLVRWRRTRGTSELVPLLFPLIYSSVVFAIFESGSRQHIAATGPLIVLSAKTVSRLRPFSNTLTDPKKAHAITEKRRRLSPD